MLKIAKVNCLSPFLRKSTLLAILFHDFGKLDKHCQTVLSQPDYTHQEMLNHTDAGVAWCLREYERTKDIAYVYAAFFIHAHHIGLKNRDDLFSITFKNLSPHIVIHSTFRDTSFHNSIQNSVKHYIDQHLDDLYRIQYALLGKEIDEVRSLTYSHTSVSPLKLRMAFSALVDADHGDTARHYGAPTFATIPLKPEQRLEKLLSSVEHIKQKSLESGIPKEVVDSRNQLFNECRNIDIHRGKFFVCSAPTGKGKTFSLMQLALRIAKEKHKEKIFCIIPYTNIISQSVQNYRKTLVLENEDELYTINEIHSKVEFNNGPLQKYTHLWNAPINVSTSVQFFESLFSNKPSQVRKLIQFYRSVIIFDEFHTALPHHLWNIALEALKDLSESFDVDVIFGSGTYVYYWDIFDDIKVNVIDVVSDTLFEAFKKFEQQRITFTNLGVMSSDVQFYNEFCRIAVDTNGNLKKHTAIVCNTVKNAVYMTKYFKDHFPQWDIYHLSSYLTPVDRERILQTIDQRLKTRETNKILLVASPIIECGVDISFELGFREYGSMLSTIQFGGRINRHKEHSNAVVYEFSFDPQFINNSNFSRNPHISLSIAARNGCDVDMDCCTEVIHNEIMACHKNDLVDQERAFRFEYIQNHFSVIGDETVSVVVDADIIRHMLNNSYVKPVIINRHSIAIHKSKIDPHKAHNWSQYIRYFTYQNTDIAYWVGPYDPNVYGVYACEIL